MLNARHSFLLLWQRLVAALSLVMAAALTPAAVSAPAGGAGPVGSRIGSGTTVSSAASAPAGKIANPVEGAQQQLAREALDGGTKTKACTPTVWKEITPPCSEAAHPPHASPAPRQTHAPRSGPSRAPPVA